MLRNVDAGRREISNRATHIDDVVHGVILAGLFPDTFRVALVRGLVDQLHALQAKGLRGIAVGELLRAYSKGSGHVAGRGRILDLGGK